MGKSDTPPQDRMNPKPLAKSGPSVLRAARLKAALKANMARRKSQAKARQAPDNKNEG